ncbi:DNA-binding XRE family transcriptional regulator [Aneurinibacillus soli]|uniref:Helix-turn-helix domain protein n=1 Tax=Aneurinibacillus soli TaxID=1500254 RepID=A0A0U5B0W0_9BACL|nr:helix-turn-helix domain-containing protein [Aneurinibacillus soli]PYE58172.1 DNA-binding XRE family transcriptional regulator [Aneurinibacillus soli]BAU27888.1 Helix-turn-helix domain protein [Aneurinibacillus soli]
MNGHEPVQFTKDMLDRMISEKVRLIRTEAKLTQEQMADVLGLSKKTLVQVEKERKTLGFTAAALVGALFRDSEIMQGMFGESALEVMRLTAFDGIEQGDENGADWISRARTQARYKAMGRRVWWKDEQEGAVYILQSHILTGHCRIIDREDALQYYGADLEEAQVRLRELEEIARDNREKER